MFLVTDTLSSLENCKIHSIPFLILNDKISGLHFGYASFGCKKDWMQKRLDAKKKLAAKKIGWTEGLGISQDSYFDPPSGV